MNRQPHFEQREIIVAEAVQEFVSELRMVDAGDLIAYIRLEKMATLADVIESAAELYFMPGTVRLGHGCEAHVSWNEAPRIVLDLELKPEGATVYCALTLSESHAEITVNFVSFDDASGGKPALNTERLRHAMKRARIGRAARLDVR
ncbi:MAG: hypothetical protein K5872_23505 [Rhizobiaceae bacterium]|nr:hypothetical protein [Rhizobiaceae bacterium]MCV0409188.1 hypothetical protein [Rhizobiaceae bacterium]